MDTLSPEAAEYVAFWRRVLSVWLKWPEERIVKFIAIWQEDLTAPEDSVASKLFFHDSPIEYLSRLLQPSALRRRYIGPDDNPFEIDHKIEHAVNREYHYDSERYDWDAARRRVEAALAEYDASLPTPDDLAPHEEQEKRQGG